METVIEHLIKAAELLIQQENTNKERLDNLENKLDLILERLNNTSSNNESNQELQMANTRIKELENKIESLVNGDTIQVLKDEIDRKENVIKQLEIRNQELDWALENARNNEAQLDNGEINKIELIKNSTLDELRNNNSVNKLFLVVNQSMHILKPMGYTYDKELGFVAPQQEVYNQPTETLQPKEKITYTNIDERLDNELQKLYRDDKIWITKYNFYINNQLSNIIEIAKLYKNKSLKWVIGCINEGLVNGVYEKTGKESGIHIKVVDKNLLIDKNESIEARIEREINELSDEDKEWINKHNYFFNDKQIFINDIIKLYKTKPVKSFINGVKKAMKDGVYTQQGASGNSFSIKEISLANNNVDNSLQEAIDAYDDNNVTTENVVESNTEANDNNDHVIINKDGIIVAQYKDGEYASYYSPEEEEYYNNLF